LELPVASEEKFGHSPVCDLQPVAGQPRSG